MENERTTADGLRLVALGVRVLVYAALGGAALIAIAIVTVASVLGPALALDLYTPPVAAWWTVFTAVGPGRALPPPWSPVVDARAVRRVEQPADPYEMR